MRKELSKNEGENITYYQKATNEIYYYISFVSFVNYVFQREKYFLLS